jgi:type I restriction enzyme S subunit
MKRFDVVDSEERVTDAGSRTVTLVPAGSVLFVVRGMSLANEFRVGVAGREVAFNQDIRAVVPSQQIDGRYLARYLQATSRQILSLVDEASHGTKRLTSNRFENVQVPVPSLVEQRRIAEILDKADALRAKRRATLAQLDTLTEAIFINMFGDPSTNPKQWPHRTIGDIASTFSDGPFGSNLKTEHYTQAGIRVVRLQNIGIGRFLDRDKSYISEKQFAKLSKHECRPGDVLIATLGDPNLRACMLPESVPIALNKADCVQFRARSDVASGAYVSALLNQPSVAQMAQGLMLGQTRVRISMGRLRGLRVPVPPLPLQQEFAGALGEIEDVKRTQEVSLTRLDALFASLQHRAFRGEL